MAPKVLPRVLLVGSVPFSTSEEVFLKLSDELPGLVKTLPDGETGERSLYVLWQHERYPPEIRSCPFIPMGSKYDPTFQLEDSDIKPTGYDTAALASYKTFRELREQGKIPSDVRFQVCLPSPINAISTFVGSEHKLKAEQFYEKRLLEALATIQEAIPSSDLVIQWDLCFEVLHTEYAYGPERDGLALLQPYYTPVREGIAERLVRLAAAVKQDVPMGWHLCYGDYNHEHFIQPHDLNHLVDLTNFLHEAVSPHHAVEWIHMPIPKNRTDEAFFSPLSRLIISKDCTLFLGVVHAHDMEGTEKRIDAAYQALAGRTFGIATECGLGRTPLSDIDSIFQISREVTKQN